MGLPPMKISGAGERDLLELQCFALAQSRAEGLSMDLTAAYVRIHDSTSELAKVIATGKHGDGVVEAAEVLYHLFALTQSHGVSIRPVLHALLRKIDAVGWPSQEGDAPSMRDSE